MILQTERYTPPSYPTIPRKRGFKPTFKGFLLWHVLVVFYLFTDCLCSGQLAFAPGLVDLSHVFDNTTIYWVTGKPLSITVTFNGTTEKGYWYQSEEMAAATHGGTHMDAPCHFAKGQWCIADIPPSRLVVPAVVVDISNDVNGDPSVHLTPEHLISWEKKHGRIPEKSLLLVYTGWSQFWPDPLAYSGTVEKDASLLRFPSLTPESAQWLVDNRDVVGVGIDTMSIDIPSTPNEPQRSHQILFQKNIYGLENVNNLHKLPPTGSTAYVLPMKLKDASGAPCRILASIPSEQTSNTSSGMFSFHLMFFVVLLYSIFA